MQKNMFPKKLIEIDVLRALHEDVGSGDISVSLIAEDTYVNARIYSREPMLCCGQEWVSAVFAHVDAEVLLKWQVLEGEWLDTPMLLCEIKGKARSILTAERTALNFLQTLSATATQAYHYQQKLSGYKTRLLDTRKTIPGLRYAQKYAVTCGGGMNHRLGLFDAFLIKENHILACGSITNAVNKARELKPDVMLEVEVETFSELKEALNSKPDRIMLDNFSIEELTKAVALSKPYGCPLEASGNINLETVKDIAKTGVDFISVGSITKSIKAIDLSLLIETIL